MSKLSKGGQCLKKLSSPRTVQKICEKRQSSVYEDKHTPLNFDDFVPWVCLEWQVGERIVVIRRVQEEYMPISSRQKKISSLVKNKVSKQIEESDSIEEETIKSSSIFETFSTEACISITAFYDSRNRLTEISIIGCKYQIHQKVIKAISLCLPFHQSLRRLVIQKGGLSSNLLYEISKMLPHSNLTDVILDGSYVPEGNYFLLLDNVSHLIYLSLSKCQINDLACQQIMKRLEAGKTGSNTLKILDLSNNFITDRGAKCIGLALKSNRCLLHLNLAGNCISDEGAFFIFYYLMEFEISHEDLLERNRRRMEFAQRKLSINKKDLEVKESITPSVTSKKRGIFTKKDVFRLTAMKSTVFEPVDQFGFKDPFESKYLTKRDDFFFSVGNMILCSLNLAYNDLKYPSVKKIIKVLEYQNQWAKHFGYSGLLRIILDGNSLPIKCTDYDVIYAYLNQAKMTDKIQVPDAKSVRLEGTNNVKNSTSVSGEKKTGKKKLKKSKTIKK